MLGLQGRSSNLSNELILELILQRPYETKIFIGEDSEQYSSSVSRPQVNGLCIENAGLLEKEYFKIY